MKINSQNFEQTPNTKAELRRLIKGLDCHVLVEGTDTILKTSKSEIMYLWDRVQETGDQYIAVARLKTLKHAYVYVK